MLHGNIHRHLLTLSIINWAIAIVCWTISAYLGKRDKIDQAMNDFAGRYADQNERDYEAFLDAVRSGRLDALEGV